MMPVFSMMSETNTSLGKIIKALLLLPYFLCQPEEKQTKAVLLIWEAEMTYKEDFDISVFLFLFFYLSYAF